MPFDVPGAELSPHGVACSLDAFLKLAKAVGAVPWVNVPMSLTDSELSSLGSYFASEQAKYNFPAILLEFADDAQGQHRRPPGRHAGR